MPLLHWLTRDDDIKTATHVPYRLLEEEAQLSHGDRDTGNMLIQGDNLDALKALLPYYAGKVKCETWQKRMGGYCCNSSRMLGSGPGLASTKTAQRTASRMRL